MHWVDGHLDLGYLSATGRDLTRHLEDHETGCISLPALRDANMDTVFGTIYTEAGSPDASYGYDSSDDLEGAEDAGMRQLEVYERLEEAGEISIVRTRSDLENEIGVLKVLLLMECADPIRSPEHARKWFNRGLRMVGMTWNARTRYACGCGSSGPLTSAGNDLVAAMDDLGMVHDISHLSDESASELFETSSGNVVATHSNCRSLLDDSQRHLPDEFIREISRREGVVGLNLYTQFLATDRRATVKDAVHHVLHVAGVMDHRKGVALGSDADGGFEPPELPEGLDHPSKLGTLAAALESEGWPESDISGFAHGNWLSFLKRVLPV